MNITLKRVDKGLPLPEYHTKGSVAFDFVARTTVEIAPFTPTIIPLNLVIETPPGYMLMLASRSSLPLKKGLMVANGIGVIDQDYCGEKDEIGLQVLNFTQKPVKVERGERVAQGIFVKIETVTEFIEVEAMNEESRGGFGSTGI